MRWIQWAERADLQNGMGGAEVHARCVDRELKKLGIESFLSNRKEDLKESEWDVIHTHGDTIPFIFPKHHKKATRLHTFHGSTLGVMAALKAWTWPAGYYRSLVEVKAMIDAKVVAAVQPRVWVYSLAKKIGKTCVTCWNGWDSEDVNLGEVALPEKLQQDIQQVRKFAVFIGRGNDPFKDTPYLKKVWSKHLMDVPLLAAPGIGFEDFSHAIPTTKLTSNQIKTLLKSAGVLVLTSKYEGLPLVVLEALSEGVPVVTHSVGGIPQIDPKVKGLFSVPRGKPRMFADNVRKALEIPQEQRMQNMEINRALLPRWQHVASSYLNAVKKHRNFV